MTRFVSIVQSSNEDGGWACLLASPQSTISPARLLQGTILFYAAFPLEDKAYRDFIVFMSDHALLNKALKMIQWNINFYPETLRF